MLRPVAFCALLVSATGIGSTSIAQDSGPPAAAKPRVNNGCADYFYMSPPGAYRSPYSLTDSHTKNIIFADTLNGSKVKIVKVATPQDPNELTKYEIGPSPSNYLVFYSMKKDGKTQRLLNQVYIRYADMTSEDVVLEFFDKTGLMYATDKLGPHPVGVRQYAYIDPPSGQELSAIGFRASSLVLADVCLNDGGSTIRRLKSYRRR